MKQEDRPVAETVLRGLLELRKSEQMRQQYAGIEPGNDGRIRTNLQIPGTRTGRLSSRESFLEASANLQNLAKTQAKRDELYEVRQCFQPTPGKALGASDLSSAERRLLAYLADEKTAIEWTEKGDEELNDSSYSYKKFGERFFDDVSDWRNLNDSQYAVSKMIVLSLDRGVGPRKLKKQVNKDADITSATLSASQAKEAHELFHSLFPGYREYFDEMERWVRQHGYTTNVLGRKRYSFAKKTKGRWDQIARDLVSFQAQAVGDLLNQRMRWIYDELDPHLVQIVLNVHDEVIFEFDPADVYEVKRKTLEIMERPISLERAEPPTPHEEITIPADFEMSTESWGDLEEV